MERELFISGSIWTIFLISTVTYGFRLGGLLLADWLPHTGPLRRFLDALPGTILLSLVVPQAVHAGLPGLIGLAACLGAFWGTRNLLITMFAGVGAVWLIRTVGLG
jgi:uncharacterized membrane protein